MPPSPRFGRPISKLIGGFTLIELMTVIAVILILATLLVQGFASIKAKAQRAVCGNNLRNLFLGASGYMQDHQSWPQIAATDSGETEYALNWVNALKPYNIQHINWICPTIQGLLQNPDYTQGEDTRIDYLATPFDDQPNSPYKWSTQPWFAEKADVHGDGNLIMFPNGALRSLNDVKNDHTRPEGY